MTSQVDDPRRTVTSRRGTAVRKLPVEPVSVAAFAPFGTVLEAMDDGTPFTAQEQLLDVSQGTPRFYLMRLVDKPPVFRVLTRHLQTTQSLISVGGKEWILVVAPPGDPDRPGTLPDVDDVRAFSVPGDVAVLMKRGCWHSGPHFDAPEMSFVNLELADTNQVDHATYRIGHELGLEFELTGI
jgi:ureidoglycolate lyase